MTITEAVVADDTEQLRIIWFNQPFLTQTLHVGDSVFFSGKIKADMFGLSLVSPAYEKDNGNKETMHTARLVPIYPVTAGITQKQFRFLLSQIIDVADTIHDWVHDEIVEKAKLVSLRKALRWIHFPKTDEDRTLAEERLKFDELFILQLRAEMLRQTLARLNAPALPFHEVETKVFVSGLPFALTKDQKIAAWEILQNIEKSEPMNRLLQGDVGSGKTVVAGLAAYTTVLSGYQTVFLAPTEILAFQHYETLKKLFQHTKISIGLLTSSRQEIYGDIAEIHKDTVEIPRGKKLSPRISKYLSISQAKIVVGTHALLSEKVSFNKLGLVIVDEQHRFGVAQRKQLRDVKNTDGTVPHFLSMTATPIPRSLALTLYGDLDISIIRTMPEGRKKILTKLVEPHEREKAYQFIREQVKQGRQVFVVCPLIEAEDSVNHKSFDDRKSVLSEFEKLSKKVFPELRVGFLHGKLPASGGKLSKEQVMKDFSEGKIDLLVSTSVIEVGVNIPNASVMIIEDADRFGLAQLHQFRGRVGRSVYQSYCLLFTSSGSAKERLKFFSETNDGFTLAEYDLRDRGPGEVYGTEQSGMMQLRLASMRDVELIKKARDLARGIDFSKYSSLKEKVKEWEGTVHLE
jgi:ATP-dependent DNA helicase RecG